jgi:hypothetical protein
MSTPPIAPLTMPSIDPASRDIQYAKQLQYAQQVQIEQLTKQGVSDPTAVIATPSIQPIETPSTPNGKPYAVVFFLRFKELRPDEKRIREIFTVYGDIDHCMLPINVNYAFVYMRSLMDNGTKGIMHKINSAMKDLPIGDQFSITLARPQNKRTYVHQPDFKIADETLGIKSPHPYYNRSRITPGVRTGSSSTGNGGGSPGIGISVRPDRMTGLDRLSRLGPTKSDKSDKPDRQDHVNRINSQRINGLFPTMQKERLQKNVAQSGRGLPPYRATVSRVPMAQHGHVKSPVSNVPE